MPCPPEVLALLQKFADHREDYQSAGYNEAQLRQEFVDPLFQALGWDMDNTQGHAEAYKDVIHEDAIKVGGGHKAPDYCFRIGGTRKFFVEAKKPSVNIKDAIDPAFQLRRYAWSAKLPLSILTDFEELAVYDCRIKPDKDDKSSTARVLYLRGAELAERWDELAAIFSREAILKGSFDKFAESNKKKRGTAEVDAAFLADIEGWRLDLAKNLALRNPQLEQRELNFAVQRIIDRIIFLRIAEDRGIEDYGRLQAITNGESIYRRLGELFRHADDRYNSGLFHFEPEKGRQEPPDDLTLNLEIDDKILRELVRGLYYPESPYEFSVLSADILGQVYEQFLGKVIHLTAGHRAVVEEKPEVRKAGGVYYTPTYIVDYIVQQTVGQLLGPPDPKAATSGRGLTPKQAAKLRILDPACGSGSFLIGAFQHLLDWHRDWYLADGPEKHRKELFQSARGQWQLTIAERKRILLNNIYGVDIDLQAVEVTKLSLCLKVLENANRAALDQQIKIFHKDRALPDLGGNIKCGNSLIGPDFYNGQQMSFLDEEEKYRINVFDWHGKDGFAEIMQAGGFDAVIGNPPYVNIRVLTQVQCEQVKDYFEREYRSAYRGYDLYVLFVEKGTQLLREGGRWGMIVPNKIGTLDYSKACRELLLERTTIQSIVDTSAFRVFDNASVYPYVIVWENQPASKNHRVGIVHSKSPEDFFDPSVATTVLQKKLDGETGFTIHGELDVESRVATAPLSDRCQLDSGTTGFVAQEMAKSLSERKSKSGACFDFIVSGNIDRFAISLGEVRFMKRSFVRPVLPKNSPILTSRKRELYAAKKIVIAGMTKRIEAAWDETGLALGVQVFSGSQFLDSPHYVLGVLNSNLISYLFRLRFQAKHLAGGFLAINMGQLAKLPIRLIDEKIRIEKAQRDKIIQLVDQMLALHAKLAQTKPGHSQSVIQRQIDATDRQIDLVVYQLYGLTDAEIALVEAATK